MNDTEIRLTDIPATGTPLAGGFATRLYRRDNALRLLITAPKSLEISGKIWLPNQAMLAGALSLTDGLANTKAMAEAGNKFAQDLLAEGWHLPALNQAELQYRSFKPTADDNFCMSGCNISAEPPTERYLPQDPAQTTLEAFRKGGAEAFDPAGWHATSSQYAGGPGSAWYTGFIYGFQLICGKDITCRGRPVRDLSVIS